MGSKSCITQWPRQRETKTHFECFSLDWRCTQRHLSEVIFVTRLVYLLLAIFFLTQLPRAVSWALTAKCSCWVAEAPTVCAKGAPLYHGLLEASHLQSMTAFYISPPPPPPMFRVTVQSFGTLPSPGRVNVIMLWSVLLNASAGIMSPVSSWASPRFKSPPCLCVLHSCSFQEITIQEIPSL